MTVEDSTGERRRQLVVATLAEQGIRADLTDEQQYKDRYRIFRGPRAAILDIYYDSKQRVTVVESGSADGEARLILESIVLIESLPAGILRPRFAHRLSSPSRLVEQHEAALAEAGLVITGMRIAQFQLMYDIESSEGTVVHQPTHMMLSYNRRGIVTSCETDLSEIAHRAISTLGLESVAVHRRHTRDATEDL